MSKGIGEIIAKLREEAGFTQKQLCEGICSASELTKIELNQLVPGHFQLDRLFARVGKSTERLEYVLPKEVYELYELQYLIQTNISQLELEKAEALLQQYEEKKQAASSLHRQFVEQERAQILWMRGEETESVLKFLNQAIERTMNPDGVFKSGTAYSAEELKLLLFRWEVSRGTPWERPRKELSEVIRYLEQHKFDDEEKVKVYPYAALLLAEEMDVTKEYDVICYRLRTSLELLREEGKILYMPETLETYAGLLEYGNKESEFVIELRNWRSSLLSIEEEFGIHLEKYRLFQHLDRAFELDYEVIRQERKASGISQERLAEEICTPESLSRIENGKRSPSNRNMEALLKKMNRERTRINPIITAESYETFALEKEIDKCGALCQFEKQHHLMKELETKLDFTVKENQQYIMTEKVWYAYYKGEISCETGVAKLYEILKMTLNDEENIYAYRLTRNEMNVLNKIACHYYWNYRIEEAAELWRKLIANYEESAVSPAFRVHYWDTITGNLALMLEGLDSTEEPIEICRQRLKIALSVGRGTGILRSLDVIADVLEKKQHDEECIRRYRQALDMAKLMKLEYRYDGIKEYVEEQGLLEKVMR